MLVSRKQGTIRLVVAQQPYNCGDCKNLDGSWSRAERAERWCTLPDHGRPAWAGASPRGYRGQLGKRERGEWVREDIGVTGCPAGYQDSHFAASVSAYARLSGRSNRLYDRLEDDLTIEAVHFYESHVEGCRGLFEHARVMG